MRQYHLDGSPRACIPSRLRANLCTQVCNDFPQTISNEIGEWKETEETRNESGTREGWYRERWQIEQLFRTLKKQGFNIESSQIENGENLMKLVSLATQAAAYTLQLTMARDGNAERPATDIFDEDEITLLKNLQPQLEGRTAKQKNPYPQGKLSWTAWMIARLGGWNGYASEAKPPSRCSEVNGNLQQWHKVGNLQTCVHRLARLREREHKPLTSRPNDIAA